MSKITLLLVILGCSCVLSLRYSRPFGVKKPRSQCYKSCVRFADHVRREKSIKDPEEQAKEFCTHLNFFDNLQEQCQQVVKFSKMVHIYVKAGLPKHRICRYSKICPNERNKVDQPKDVSSKPKNTIACKACKSLVAAVSFGVKVFNYTEKKMISDIQYLCNLLSPLKVQAKVCKVILDEVDSIFQMILKGITPGPICKKLGLCTNSSEEIETLADKILQKITGDNSFIAMYPKLMKKAMVLKNSVPIAMVKYIKQKKTETENVEAAAAANIGNGTFCTICKTITNMIAEDIKFANATIKTIEEAVKLFCDLQLGPIKKICLNFVSKIDEIVQYIEKGMTPGDICAKLGFCTKVEEEIESQVTKSKPLVVSSCQICDSLSKVIDDEMKDYRSTAGKMRGYIADVCKNTHQTDVQEKCLSLAPVFTVMDGITDTMMDPSMCRSVMCSKPFEMAASILQNGMSGPCSICIDIVALFTARLKNFEKIIEESLNEVDKLCGYIVYKEISQQCHMSVNRTRALFQAIVKKLNPKTICAVLGICPKKEQKESSIFDEMIKIATSGGSPACSICKVAVESVQQETNAQTVRKTLEETCSGISMIAGNKVCTKLLGHLDTIVGSAEEKQSPKQVCKKLQLCEKEVPVMKVIGGIVDGLKDLFSDW